MQRLKRQGKTLKQISVRCNTTEWLVRKHTKGINSISPTKDIRSYSGKGIKNGAKVLVLKGDFCGKTGHVFHRRCSPDALPYLFIMFPLTEGYVLERWVQPIGDDDEDSLR